MVISSHCDVASLGTDTLDLICCTNETLSTKWLRKYVEGLQKDSPCRECPWIFFSRYEDVQKQTFDILMIFFLVNLFNGLQYIIVLAGLNNQIILWLKRCNNSWTQDFTNKLISKLTNNYLHVHCKSNFFLKMPLHFRQMGIEKKWEVYFKPPFKKLRRIGKKKSYHKTNVTVIVSI